MPGVRCAQYTACRSVQLEDELSVSPLRPRQASLSPGKLDALLGSASHETLATNSHRSPVGVIVGAGDGAERGGLRRIEQGCNYNGSC